MSLTFFATYENMWCWTWECTNVLPQRLACRSQHEKLSFTRECLFHGRLESATFRWQNQHCRLGSIWWETSPSSTERWALRTQVWGSEARPEPTRFRSISSLECYAAAAGTARFPRCLCWVASCDLHNLDELPKNRDQLRNCRNLAEC